VKFIFLGHPYEQIENLKGKQQQKNLRLPIISLVVRLTSAERTHSFILFLNSMSFPIWRIDRTYTFYTARVC